MRKKKDLEWRNGGKPGDEEILALQEGTRRNETPKARSIKKYFDKKEQAERNEERLRKRGKKMEKKLWGEL